MNLPARFAEIWTPPLLKKRELQNLFAITASVFQNSAPSTAGLSFDRSLVVFADFSKHQVDLAAQRGEDLQPIRERLFEGAFKFGKKFRRLFGVSSRRDVMRVGRLLYSMLGIDFQGDEQGGITIRRCFFSRCYSASTCRVISSLDAGMLAGLADGGTLEFSQRITEGFDYCAAMLTFKDG
jgi:hypothetical protein